MSIKNKRQQSTTASPAAPTSLNYGEIAIANDGTLYAGDKTNKAVSQVKFAETCDLAGNAVNASAADSAETATKDASGNTITTSYGAAIDASGNTIRLKAKSGAVLATLTVPFATRMSYPNGFSGEQASTGDGWGNQTGTFITGWATAGGGAISFRNNNPSSGKVSMKIDGVIYQNEGTNKVVDSSNSSYNGNLYINV
jgi:hypothetical protein